MTCCASRAGAWSTRDAALRLLDDSLKRLGTDYLDLWQLHDLRDGQDLATIFARGGALQYLLLRYTRALLTQIAQTAVCNRLHMVEQRLCRWLLLCHDRVRTNELQLTQELISNMLGGRRESVTLAAGRLQDAGVIRYSRGHITILDRKGLEAWFTGRSMS